MHSSIKYQDTLRPFQNVKCLNERIKVSKRHNILTAWKNEPKIDTGKWGNSQLFRIMWLKNKINNLENFQLNRFSILFLLFLVLRVEV